MRSRRRPAHRPVAALALLAFAACHGPVAPAPAAAPVVTPAPAMGESDALDRNEIEERLDSYAATVVHGTPGELADFFADDGELLQPGMAALRGPAAIRGFLAPLRPRTTIESSRLDSDDLEIAGDRAWQWGRFAQRCANDGGPMRDYGGRFVAQWARGPDGTWKLRRLLMQPD